ncbi:MAG: hypothetical protein KC589_08175 [Nanoarchaeota archaeon]|nr:hypothetical protein [Nanoarchaeota archaeon]MCA9496897.1 hypothetical protein [Nanoarchaeota archaeon]
MTKGTKKKRREIMAKRRDDKEKKNNAMVARDRWEEKKRAKQNKKLEQILQVGAGVEKALERSDYVESITNNGDSGLIKWTIPQRMIEEHIGDFYGSSRGSVTYNIDGNFDFVLEIGPYFDRKQVVLDVDKLPKAFEDKIWGHFEKEYGFLFKNKWNRGSLY